MKKSQEEINKKLTEAKSILDQLEKLIPTMQISSLDERKKIFEQIKGYCRRIRSISLSHEKESAILGRTGDILINCETLAAYDRTGTHSDDFLISKALEQVKLLRSPEFFDVAT